MTSRVFQSTHQFDIVPFARCADCGAWAVAELKVSLGICLPFCHACIDARTQEIRQAYIVATRVLDAL